MGNGYFAASGTSRINFITLPEKAKPTMGKLELQETVATILAELHEQLAALYGARLVQLWLYGSQARQEATADSDIDVLVVLAGQVNPYQEIARAGGITAALSLKYDVVISCMYVSATANQTDNPLWRNVQREGVAV
jgi:uncharacterized protein